MRKAIELLLFSIIFCSCRKEISLDLEADENQIVIEATLSANQESRVIITKTKSVFSKSNYSGVSDAIVYITSDRGQILFFSHVGYIEAGYYEPDRDNFDIWPGITYTLHVEVEGKTYTAISKMPFPVSLDSISVTKSPLSLPGSTRTNYALIPRYTDPKGVKNFYRFVLNSSFESDNNIYLINDNQSDGLVNNTLFLSFSDLYEGQKLEIEMQMIDEATYDYFYGLRNNILGQAGGPTPAEPVGNITGGAIGYFSAYSTSQNEVYIR